MASYRTTTTTYFDHDNTSSDVTMTQQFLAEFSLSYNITYSAFTDETPGDQEAMPMWLTLVLGFLGAVVSIVTILGNLIVLLSFVIERSIRQPTNYFIASLAVSDLIIGTVSMPFYTLYLLSNKSWLLGEILCDLWLSIDYTVCLCSIYTVFCITIDRFCSVKIPAKYRNWRTHRKVAVIVAITWTVPICVFFTTIIGWQYFVGGRTVPPGECYVQYMENPIFNCFLQVGYFWITLTVMCFLYSGIYRVALNLQKKSEAKQKKMTTLVSVAGQEISKIGIGVTQRPSVVQIPNKDRNAVDIRTGMGSRKRSADMLTTDDEDDDIKEQQLCCGRNCSNFPGGCGSHCVSTSANRNTAITDERSSSPAFASDSSQSPDPLKSSSKPPPYNKLYKHMESDKKVALRAKPLILPLPPGKKNGHQNRAEKAASFIDNIPNKSGHVSAESVDNITTLDEQASVYPFSSTENVLYMNNQYSLFPEMQPCRIDGLAGFYTVEKKELNCIDKPYNCIYSTYSKCHRSAEVLYCTADDLPCRGNHLNTNHLINDYEPLRHNSVHYGNKIRNDSDDQNVFYICDNNLESARYYNTGAQILDGSEFLLRRHVDSGMGARVSMGSLPPSDYRTDTDEGDLDSPVSPIWKLRQDSASITTLPPTPDDFSSTSMEIDSSKKSRKRKESKSTGKKRKVDKSGGISKGDGGKKDGFVFKFPPIPPRSANNKKDIRNVELDCNRVNENQLSDCKLDGRKSRRSLLKRNETIGHACDNKGADFSRAQSVYDYAALPDTAMTNIPDDWEDKGPNFDDPGPKIGSSFRLRRFRESASSNSGEWKASRRKKRRVPLESTASADNDIDQSSCLLKPSLLRQRIKLLANGKKNAVASIRSQDSAATRDGQNDSRYDSKMKSLKSSKSENRARKALRTISIILGAFVLCWTPWHVLSLIISIHGDDPPLSTLYDISYWLCYLNSPINPFCYAFVNQQFKKTFVRILKFDWHRT